jgi:IS5 family transposase
VRAESLEKLNQALLAIAVEDGIEDGNTVRGDCTAVETTIHAPKDSWLLYDTVRVLARTMKKAQKFGVTFQNHTRRAKRRSCAIPDTGSSAERARLYSDLLEVTENTLRYADAAIRTLSRRKNPKAIKLRKQLTSSVKLGRQVVDQTRRRVFGKETVPASEKVVSIFEPHTDIIVKSRRDVEYGHKICLTTGPSSMVLDCVILSGNPADASLATDMMERHEEIFGHVPEHVAFDGGFASRVNLEELKEMGIEDVVFSKRRGIKVHEMVKESWAYKWLRDFRAGIEGCISFFKRSFGLSRCRWKGLESFNSYVWASMLSANLLIYSRHRLAQI